MKTLSEFQTYVERDLKRDDKSAEIIQAYNDTIWFIADRYPLSSYQFQSYITLVASQEDYPLPCYITHLIHPIRLLEGTAATDSGWQLNQLTKDEYDMKYPNPNRTSPDDTGEPVDYCIYSGGILLGPTPDNQGWLLEINWCKDQTELSASSDVPSFQNFMEKWDEILKWGVLGRVYEGMGMYEDAAYWWAKFMDPEIGYKAKIEQDKGISQRMECVQFNDL